MIGTGEPGSGASASRFGYAIVGGLVVSQVADALFQNAGESTSCLDNCVTESVRQEQHTNGRGQGSLFSTAVRQRSRREGIFPGKASVELCVMFAGCCSEGRYIR